MRNLISTRFCRSAETDDGKRLKITKLLLLTLLAMATMWAVAPRFTPVRGQVRATQPKFREQAQATQPKFRKHARAIANRYIVVLNDDAVKYTARDLAVAEIGASFAKVYGARIERTYKHALKGYAMEMTEAQAQALSQDP